MSNLAEKFWPQWCNRNRAFLSEDDIVSDLLFKIKNNRTTLTFWVLIEETDVTTFSKQHNGLIVRYYNIASKRNPFFRDNKDPLEDVQLRILQKVWQAIHIFEHDRETQSKAT